MEQVKIDIKEKFIKDKIERIKKQTRPVDVLPLMKFMYDTKDIYTEEQKQGILQDLGDAFDSSGKLFLDRCFTEGDMTEKEYLEIKEKYKLEDSDFGILLQAYYAKRDGFLKGKDGKDDDKVVVATSVDSNILKCRDFILKRFGVTILSTDECVVMMKKELDEKGIDYSMITSKGVKDDTENR